MGHQIFQKFAYGTTSMCAPKIIVKQDGLIYNDIFRTGLFYFISKSPFSQCANYKNKRLDGGMDVVLRLDKVPIFHKAFARREKATRGGGTPEATGSAGSTTESSRRGTWKKVYFSKINSAITYYHLEISENRRFFACLVLKVLHQNDLDFPTIICSAGKSPGKARFHNRLVSFPRSNALKWSNRHFFMTVYRNNSSMRDRWPHPWGGWANGGFTNEPHLKEKIWCWR